MQFLADLDNYISNSVYPTWYKYSDECSGIIPPMNGRRHVSTEEFVDDLSECLKNNKYPAYYKYTSCSGVITPDMPANQHPANIPAIVTPVDINNILLDTVPHQKEKAPEIYYMQHKDETYELPMYEGEPRDRLLKYTNGKSEQTKIAADIIDRIEYSMYSNDSAKDKIHNMIKKVYRYNDDKYKQACKYILSKFSDENNGEPIASLNKLLDEKNIYKSSEFDYNPILRLLHVKNIDNIITIDDMRKVFTILY